MKHRSPVAVLLLPFITFGIYSIYWMVTTKGELNKQGAHIPTAWLIIVPFVNIWWMWKYSEGVELVAKEKMSAIIAFILLFLLGFIGMAIIQSTYNGLSPVAADAPAAEQSVTDTPSTPPATETTESAESAPNDAPAAPSAETPSDEETPPSGTQPGGLVQ